jgi:hypothetical protein
MSLGDTLRLLRAQRGGITPFEIETALPDLPKGIYRQMEQRYRSMGDDDSIRLLAGFFGVPYVELRAQLEWPRKALSRALVYAQARDIPISLHLSIGEHVTGKVLWWDLGAVGLVTAGGEWVIQRHAVRQWEPRAPEETLDDEAGDG